jgi:hypothetical protein
VTPQGAREQALVTRQRGREQASALQHRIIESTSWFSLVSLVAMLDHKDRANQHKLHVHVRAGIDRLGAGMRHVFTCPSRFRPRCRPSVCT